MCYTTRTWDLGGFAVLPCVSFVVGFWFAQIHAYLQEVSKVMNTRRAKNELETKPAKKSKVDGTPVECK